MTNQIPKKHDNQYTTPPLTEEETLERFRALVAHGDGKGSRGKGSHDWLALMTEWIHTEPSEFPNVSRWLQSKHPEVHPGSIQKRGGRSFWNKVRDDARTVALARAIERSPDILAQKYEKQFRIVGKLEDGIERAADKLLAPMDDAPPAPSAEASEIEKKEYRTELKDYLKRKRSLNAEALKTLAEAVDRLAETNLKLKHDGVQQHEVKSVNLHATIVQSLKDRDARFGIPAD